MAYDFTIIGSALIITDTVTSDILLDLPKKDFWFNNTELNANIVQVYDTNGTNNSQGAQAKYPIADVTDGGVAATQANIRTFQHDNLGFNTASGGSGAIGFIDYADATGNVALLANTWTDIPNDGLGASTNYTFKPPSVTELIDVSTGYLDLTELIVGSELFVRNQFDIIPDINNSLLEIRYQFGAGIFEFSNEIGRLDSGSGNTYEKRDTIDFYIGADIVRTSPVIMQVRLSAAGVLINKGSYISIKKI